MPSSASPASASPPPTGTSTTSAISSQKFPAPASTATAKLSFPPRADGDATGLVVYSNVYAALRLQRVNGVLELHLVRCRNALNGAPEAILARVPVSSSNLYLRVAVAPGALCRFSCSLDGARYEPLGEPFAAKKGAWIGAKVGLFATASNPAAELGSADYDWFRVE